MQFAMSINNIIIINLTMNFVPKFALNLHLQYWTFEILLLTFALKMDGIPFRFVVDIDL